MNDVPEVSLHQLNRSKDKAVRDHEWYGKKRLAAVYGWMALLLNALVKGPVTLCGRDINSVFFFSRLCSVASAKIGGFHLDTRVEMPFAMPSTGVDESFVSVCPDARVVIRLENCDRHWKRDEMRTSLRRTIRGLSKDWTRSLNAQLAASLFDSRDLSTHSLYFHKFRLGRAIPAQEEMDIYRRIFRAMGYGEDLVVDDRFNLPNLSGGLRSLPNQFYVWVPHRHEPDFRKDFVRGV